MSGGRAWSALAIVLLSLVFGGCSSSSTIHSGVGTFVVANESTTTISINYRFAVPEAWREHSLWFLDQPIALNPGQSYRTRESNESHDLRIIIGTAVYDHYDAFIVDDGYTTYVYVHGDGGITVERFQPYL